MKKYRTAETILHGTGIGILDAVIIIRDIINNKDKSLSLNNYSYCKKIIELGENHFTTAPQKTLFEIFLEYLGFTLYNVIIFNIKGFLCQEVFRKVMFVEVI